MSIKVVPVTAGTNNLQTTAEESSRLLSWQFTEGVPQVGSIGIAAPHTGDFATQSNSNATVKIKAGKMIVKATPTDGVEGLFLVTLSADTNITIAENSTGSTRYDKIYIHLDADTLANPPADGDFTEALALKTQRDAASGAALTDTNSMLLCEITVATGFPTSPTEITNANIWDRRILSKLAATAPEWIPFNAVLTRASDTTATLVGDWTNRINIGNCLRWYSNTTLRQNYIVGVSYDAGTGLTTITITSGYITTANDSRFEENQLIQFAQYSKASSPVGFPQWFNTGDIVLKNSADNAALTKTTVVSKFSINGRLLTWILYFYNISNPGGNNIIVYLPVNRGQIIAGALGMLYGESLDGIITVLSSATSDTKVSFWRAPSEAAWSNGGLAAVRGEFSYEI